VQNNPLFRWLKSHPWYGASAVLLFLYIWSRWFGLTELPVFADEAIYIRWSQLLRSGREYLFFAMNDGKPPLFVWTLFPWLQTFSDPLWAARSWSGVVGLAQLAVTAAILRSLGYNKRSQFLAAMLVLLVPFWFLHHRLALMDGLLTLGVSLSWWGLILLDRATAQSKANLRYIVIGVALAGLGWGMALLTKTTALFWAPAFIVLAGWGYTWDIRVVAQKKRDSAQVILTRLLTFGAAGAFGLSVFLLLRFSPAFGSLFSRSGDFSYSLSQWMELGGRPLWDNFLRVTPWLSQYLRPELLSFALGSLIFSQYKRMHWLTWLLGFLTIAPLLLIGKTLHPRYFLPLAPFVTVSAAAFGSETYAWLKTQWDKKQRDAGLVAAGIVAMFVLSSLRFQLLLQWSPHLTPFVLDDREQYLTSWAAGYGIPQTRDRLLERARAGQRTTVVTEGSFGTLPDGLLLYFDRAPEISHLKIEGLAQYPVKDLPDWVMDLAATEEVWLLVNEDRFALPPEQAEQVTLIESTLKPYGGPPLQLYRITPKEVE
jgi:hypothetical protein